MKTFSCLSSLLLVFLIAGCGGKNYQRPPPSWNVNPGPGSPTQPQTTPHTVFVQGPVRYPKILYSEGMTLTRAILTAQYTDRRNPRAIFILRRGERFEIAPSSLLRGEQDPVIEPGDIIELHP